MPSLLKETLIAVEAFLERTGMAESRFGREVAGDPNLVSRMRRGRELGATIIDKITEYIAANRKARKKAPAAKARRRIA